MSPLNPPMRLLPLGAALLITLSGCATQQAGVETADPLNKRLDNTEGIAALALDRGQATQNMVADLNRKIDALSGELARLREGQAAGQRAQESATALADRLSAAEQRLSELSGKVREGVTRTTDLGAGLERKTDETDPPVAERLDDAEQRLAEMEQALDKLTAQAEESDGQSTALRAALPSLESGLAQSTSRVNDLDARLARIEKRLEDVAAMAQDALDATGMGQRRIVGKVVHAVTLTDDKTLFPINSPVLGEKDMVKLDELAARVKAMGTWFHLQIQGHTDGFGSEDYNYELGRARAEVVKNYLNEKGGIPLLRMSVISYGASEAPNYSGNSNRRIVVHVLQ
jgi:outer membrane protein OmpA-like peptidoglycan-associated protein